MLAAGRQSRERVRSPSHEGDGTIIVSDLSQLLNAKARAVIKARLNAEYLQTLPPLRALREQKPNEVTERCKGRSGRIFSDSVLCCLLPGHEPRRSAILLVESRLFDPLILLVILCNCATMAWESPLDPPGTSKSSFIAATEVRASPASAPPRTSDPAPPSQILPASTPPQVIFIGIFTAEMLTKMLAYGLISHHNSYLRDGWCQVGIVRKCLALL